MNSFREQYLSSLTETVCKIMSKPEMSQQDIQLIMLYKSELRRAEYIPMLKRIMNGAKDILGFIRQLNPQDNSTSSDIDTADISEINEIEEINNGDTV